MRLGTVNIEWLNGNALRSYPFREGSGLRPNVDGALAKIALPNSALLDVSVATSAYDEAPEMYMSALSVVNGVVSMSLSDAGTDGILASARAVLDQSGYTVARVVGVGVHDDMRGTVVFGERGDFDPMPDGVWEFDKSETMLETRCVRPSVPCVSGLYVTNALGSTETRRLRGDVALIAGDNIRLSYRSSDNAIVISADPNSQYVEECPCNDNRDPVETINGVSTANIRIEGDGECVQVETSDGRIRISDKCSKPCCGCSELTFLNEKANLLTTSLVNLRSFAENLDTRLADFIRNYDLSTVRKVEYM